MPEPRKILKLISFEPATEKRKKKPPSKIFLHQCPAGSLPTSRNGRNIYLPEIPLEMHGPRMKERTIGNLVNAGWGSRSVMRD